jgi:regulator of sigma E protease
MMDVSHLLPAVWTLVFYGVAFIVALTVVVFIHEMGHFLVGRWSGAGVEAFSIGFGKELIGWTDRYGTRWRIAAIPLGGYVKFYGDENAASQPGTEGRGDMPEAEWKKTLQGQPLAKRAAIVAAGPVANFILSILIFASLAGIYGKTTLLPRVGGIKEGSAAVEAGFKVGDIVKSIDGRPIVSFFDIMRAVSERAGERLSVDVERDSKIVTLSVVPKVDETRYQAGVIRRGLIGLEASRAPEDRVHVPMGPVEALGEGVAQVWDIIAGSVHGLIGLTNGKTQPDQISGTLGIASVVGTFASRGFADFVTGIAIVSVSVGFLNLLPIPVLDGGHLAMMLIEAIRRGKPLSDRTMEISFRVGMVFIIGLAIFALSNDVTNLWIYLRGKYPG